MRWSDAIAKPTDRKLRQFGSALAAIFLGSGLWRLGVHADAFVGGGLLIALIAIAPVVVVRPRWLQPIYLAAMVISFPLSWMVSLALLTLIYYLVVTPLGLALRLLGRDPLDRKPRLDQDSYWQKRPSSDVPKSYFRQF